MPLVNCFSTLGCPHLTLRQSVHLAQTHAVPMVEVRTVSGSNDLPATLGHEFGRPEDLADYLTDTNITIPAMGSSHRLIGDAFDFDELQELARWADAAGARFLRVFDGDSKKLDSKMLDTAEARFEKWDNIRATLGIKVQFLIETHGVLCSNAALEAFCDRFPTASILWDTHHTWAAGNALSATRKIIGPRLAHLHIKDSRMTGGKREYTLPGQGAFPMGELIDLLKHVPRESTAISLEWEKHWHPELPDLELALACAGTWS
jgi:sugar phosphate isomerase/epimerase